MCGLIVVAATDPDGRLPHEPEGLDALRDGLRHRGPDAGESWIDAGRRIALLHRRLKVIDLEGARQPMASSDGRYHLVYNGEIYNFRELRDELSHRGHAFRTVGDTEVVLAAYRVWGPECVRRLDGMFAFAVWDAHERSLFLARDPFGIKPLYYGAWGGLLYVASEASAIVADPRVERAIDPVALDLYFHHGYVPAPWTIWRGMSKLRAGHGLRLDLSKELKALPEQQPYFEPPFGAAPSRPVADETTLLDELDATLRSAVERQTVSDVPLGAFLSGGVDSTLVVSYLSELSSHPVQTFSVGYDEPAYDERAWARQVAQRFGTRHHELVIGPESVAEVEGLAAAYDEPFSDAAALPTAIVSRLAREHVTVVLSGDGGDETHAGYPRYRRAEQQGWIDAVPLGLRRTALGGLARWASSGRRRGLLEQACRDAADRYDAVTTKVPWTHRSGTYSGEVRAALARSSSAEVGEGMAGFRRRELAALPTAAQALDRFQRLDCATSLPDQMMVKLDRASMRVSLESRVPLLDRQAVALAASIPARWRVRDGRPKYLLRRLVARRMGEAFAERRKHGFRVPQEAWFRRLPREELERRVWSPGLERWLDRTALQRTIFESPRGLRFFWAYLMFAAWYRHHGAAR
jgi:asparagine synthase (glutamine-hydrolysing)